MKCPHCSTSVHIDWKPTVIPDIQPFSFPPLQNMFVIRRGFCPECQKLVIQLQQGLSLNPTADPRCLTQVQTEQILYPPYASARKLNPCIPKNYAQLFQESEQVNAVSPRASATLSRYLLQMLLHEELHIQMRTLEEELNELAAHPSIPSKLVAMLQVMRRVANFGAHPKKSTHSNEIVSVEQGESAVMLDLLEELFDFIFVKPSQQETFLKRIEEKYGIHP